jgi:hypothetical protein
MKPFWLASSASGSRGVVADAFPVALSAPALAPSGRRSQLPSVSFFCTGAAIPNSDQALESRARRAASTFDHEKFDRRGKSRPGRATLPQNGRKPMPRKLILAAGVTFALLASASAADPQTEDSATSFCKAGNAVWFNPVSKIYFELVILCAVIERISSSPL